MRGGFLLPFCVCFALALHQGNHLVTVQTGGNSVYDISVGVPEFRSPVGNVTVPLGREAVLTCSVDNLRSYKVGWLRASDNTVLTMDKRVITQNSRVSMTHDAEDNWQLRIRQVKESDRDCYICQINSSEMKSQNGCIDVLVPPDIISDESSADLSVQEGDNATLYCRATGNPPPRVTWRRDPLGSEPLLIRRESGGKLKELTEMESWNGSVLHFWRADRRQMGSFLCIASNDVPPAVSRRVQLSVNFAPNVFVPNQLLGAPLRTPVELKCIVEAYPNTINYWVKNPEEMLLEGPKYSIREERSSYKVSMWLKIHNFNLSDIGTYNCLSTNSLGKGEGTVRIYALPEPPSGPPIHNGIPGRRSSVSRPAPQELLILLCFALAGAISER